MKLSTARIPADNARGFKIVNADDPRALEAAATGAAEVTTPTSVGALRAEYEAKFGKRPFMGWSADELRARIDGAN